VKGDESDIQKLLRSLLFGSLITYGDEETVTYAKRLFQDSNGDLTVLPGDLKSSIYKAVMINATEADFDTLVELFKKSSTIQEEKVRLLQALGRTKDETLHAKALSFALSDDIRDQDKFYLIASCTATVSGRYLTWTWFKDNYDLLHEKFGTGQLLMARIVSIVTRSFSSLKQADEIEQFFQTHDCPSAERNIKQSLELIRANAAWRERDRESVSTFLKSLSSL